MDRGAEHQGTVTDRSTDASLTVLIISDVVPGHRAAGEVRLATLAGLLAEEHLVALLPLDRHLDEPDESRVEHLRSLGLEVIEARGPTALRAALAVRPYDLVLVEFWHIAERVLPLVRARQPWATVAVDTVDLHFLREQRGAAVGHPTPPGMEERKRREMAAYQAADARIFTSHAELDHYQGLGGAADRATVVSMIAQPRPRPPGPRAAVVAFVGSFWHAPNVDGVTWFVAEVWPAVRAAVPGATFAIAGSRMGEEVQRLGALEGVEIRGFVPDITALYDEAKVVVAPLRFGAGVKGKVTEALASGVAVVATSVATEGLDLVHEVDLLVADGAEAFATGVISLLTGVAAEEMGSRGRASIERLCGPEPARAALRSLCRSALPAGQRPSRMQWNRRRWWLRTLPDRIWVRARPPLAATVRRLRARLLAAPGGP